MSSGPFDADFSPSGDAPEWAPLSLTLVQYPKGDLLGKLLALVSLAPFGIASGFVTLILFRRDLHTIMFFLGTVCSEVLNQCLKNTICQARPIVRPHDYNEYGMPSSHSQYMWFFTTYMILFVCIRLHHMNNNSIIDYVSKLGIISTCLAAALAVCFGRIYLQYHTVAQVVVGAVIGAAFAACWFILVCGILTPFYPQIVTWKISEFLLVRDTSLIPNILWFEYTNIRQEARARSRKLVSMKSQ